MSTSRRRGGEDMPDIPLLHIYGQRAHHDEVFIVANPLGLERLRAAVEQALLSGQGGITEALVNDGEAYDVIVRVDDSPWTTGSTWSRRAVPYTAPHAAERNPDALWPWSEKPPDA